MVRALQGSPPGMHMRLLFVMVAVLLSVGCTQRRIPGTDIEDTDDTRAILQIMERFRSAVEAKDAQTVASLVAPEFRDDGGSPELEDDYTAANLAQKLSEQFERARNVRLGIDIKKVEVDEKNDLARVTYYWNLRYELPQLSSKPHQDSELKQTHLKKLPDGWKITSGI